VVINYPLLGVSILSGFYLANRALKTRRSISANGIETIKRFEGFSHTPYKDSAGKWTIGYGHLIQPDESFTYISVEQATKLLHADLYDAESAVRSAVAVPISQGMYDALVSFTYNVGANAFKSSTLLRYLNSGDYMAANREFTRWTKADINGDGITQPTEIVAGLVNRRNAESELFWT